MTDLSVVNDCVCEWMQYKYPKAFVASVVANGQHGIRVRVSAPGDERRRFVDRAITWTTIGLARESMRVVIDEIETAVEMLRSCEPAPITEGSYR